MGLSYSPTGFLYSVWMNIILYLVSVSCLSLHCISMAPTTWIYALSKLELVDELVARDLDSTGDFNDVRIRLRDYVASQPNSGMLTKRLVQRLPSRLTVSESPRKPHFIDVPVALPSPGGSMELFAAESIPLPGVQEPIINFARDGMVSQGINSKLHVSLVNQQLLVLPIIDGTNPVLICDFLIKATDIVDLGLVSLSTFGMLLASRTSGRLSCDLIPMVQGVESWEGFCAGLLRATCPLLVKEDLIRDHITRRFQARGETFDSFTRHIFQAARVLSYVVPEIQLVNICLQNMLPQNKIHLMFTQKPTTRQDLQKVATELANALFVQHVATQSTKDLAQVTQMNSPVLGFNTQNKPGIRSPRGVRCWSCGIWGHRQNVCPTKSSAGRAQPPPSGNASRVRF